MFNPQHKHYQGQPWCDGVKTTEPCHFNHTPKSQNGRQADVVTLLQRRANFRVASVSGKAPIVGCTPPEAGVLYVGVVRVKCLEEDDHQDKEACDVYQDPGREMFLARRAGGGIYVQWNLFSFRRTFKGVGVVILLDGVIVVGKG